MSLVSRPCRRAAGFLALAIKKPQPFKRPQADTILKNSSLGTVPRTLSRILTALPIGHGLYAPCCCCRDSKAAAR